MLAACGLRVDLISCLEYICMTVLPSTRFALRVRACSMLTLLFLLVCCPAGAVKGARSDSVRRDEVEVSPLQMSSSCWEGAFRTLRHSNAMAAPSPSSTAWHDPPHTHTLHCPWDLRYRVVDVGQSPRDESLRLLTEALTLLDAHQSACAPAGDGGTTHGVSTAGGKKEVVPRGETGESEAGAVTSFRRAWATE